MVDEFCELFVILTLDTVFAVANDSSSEELQENKITIAKVNIDENPETPSKYGIMSIPTLLLFKDGKLVSTQVGLQQKAELKSWIEGYI